MLLSLALGWAAPADTITAPSLLQQKCAVCHGASAMSGLDLRTRESVLKGGARGPAIVPGKSGESLLVASVLRTGAVKMPPGKEPLPPNEVDLIKRWIDGGAPWTGTSAADAPPVSWWSFKAPVRPPVPEVPRAGSITNPIDAFILSKLKARGLSPAPLASKSALVRRAYFDLHGLPPSPEEAGAFVNDASPDAFEKLIDRLLSSPRYGERWGRHWLDVVRYADTGGNENDMYFRNAWRYRDYVIGSFNEDKPYDVFVQEQIAADEIWPNDLNHEGNGGLSASKRRDLNRRLGTGLYTVGPVLLASALNPDQFRSERLTDWADTTGAAFLGLTFGCARCHDHKFDPIPQADYFRLQAVFGASDIQTTPIVASRQMDGYRTDYPKHLRVEDLKSAVARLTQEARQRLIAEARSKNPPDDAALKNLAEASRQTIQRSLTEDERARLDRLYREIGQALVDAPEPPPTAEVLGHVERPSDVHIELRGEWKQKGKKVQAGFPSALGGGDIPDPTGFPAISHRRKDFALWLTRPGHPLTARVMVNRIWQGHFGAGIVRTPNDFGRLGEPPDNPELLDWLASEFVSANWSMKRMHRLIMLSEAYRRSSTFDGVSFAADPENRLLWRMSPRRLEAESVRDSILAVAGALNTDMGGPPVLIPLTEEEMAGVQAELWPATTDPVAPNRRSVYLYQKRLLRIPMLEAFDLPESAVSCGRRSATNVAPQALTLLNHPFTLEQSRRLAQRLQKETPDARTWVERAWMLAYSRRPSAGEVHWASGILGGRADREVALTELCLAIFNSNEFIYLD